MNRSYERQRPGRLTIWEVTCAAGVDGEIAEEVEPYYLKGWCFEAHGLSWTHQSRGCDAGFLQHAAGHSKELIDIGALGLRGREILHH